jgi:hypothetical protein
MRATQALLNAIMEANKAYPSIFASSLTLMYPAISWRHEYSEKGPVNCLLFVAQMYGFLMESAHSARSRA